MADTNEPANIEWYMEDRAPIYGAIHPFDHLEGEGEIQVHSVSQTLDDELREPFNSDDDEAQSIRVRAETSGDFVVGRQYGSLMAIRGEVKRYALQKGFDIRFVKSETKRLTAKCQGGDCNWHLHASVMQNETTFQIKSYRNDHNCARTLDNRHASAKWLATYYSDRFKSQPDWPIPDIIETVRKEHQVNIKPSLARRGRTEAKELNYGRCEEQFKLVRSYAEEIFRSNPGSTVKIHGHVVGEGRDEKMIFERMYICMAACVSGLLEQGRPIICLDGCHLKGTCPGQLLTAVSIDGNNGVYPIAVANVETECKDSWLWFLELLQDDLGIGLGRGWTFVSDRQKGLLAAVDNIFGLAEHRFCQRHMYSNFKGRFRGIAYRDAMWNAARATTREYFEIAMRKVHELNPDAHAWLRRTPPSSWATHAFSVIPKCDLGLNNLCESFNAAILPARDKPILAMFEMIRKTMMTRIVKKYEEMLKSDDVLCPKIRKKLENLKQAAHGWSAELAGDARFEVSNGNEQFVVDLNEGVCACRRWELTGIPCVHAIPCFYFMREPVENFVHIYYHRDTYLEMYSHFIRPINGQQMWPAAENRIPIVPPERRPQPGRPKKKRVRDVDEPSTSIISKRKSTMSCSKCRRQGHNSRTCPERGSSSGAATSRDTFMGFQTLDGTQESTTRGHGT